MVKSCLFFLAVFCSSASFAQLREIPHAVMEQFQKQYPTAMDAEFRDNIVDVHVVFRLDSNRMIARYTNKGLWKETEMTWNFNLLPEEVKNGFDKSRYAAWKIAETAIVYYPGNKEQYRIRVEKSDLNRKYLFFNTNGRLLREALAL